jgi:hypothetical protein
MSSVRRTTGQADGSEEPSASVHQMEELAVSIQSQFDVRRVIAEVAQRQGVLLEEGDPLFVALEAQAVVLQEVAARLLSEIE